MDCNLVTSGCAPSKSTANAPQTSPELGPTRTFVHEQRSRTRWRTRTRTCSRTCLPKSTTKSAKTIAKHSSDPARSVPEQLLSVACTSRRSVFRRFLGPAPGSTPHCELHSAVRNVQLTTAWPSAPEHCEKQQQHS